jgi:hypothetical protein
MPGRSVELCARIAFSNSIEASLAAWLWLWSEQRTQSLTILLVDDTVADFGFQGVDASM